MVKPIKKRFTHLNPPIKILITFILLTGLAAWLPVMESPIDVGEALGATSIFYSILLGFYISAAMGNLSQLKSLVSAETGSLIAVYHFVKLALPARLESTRKAIDGYLIKRFEYEIDNYTEPTTKEFFGIFEVLKGAKAASDGEGAAISFIAETQLYTAQARREITVVGAKVVTKSSWIILNILSLVIVIALFLIRDGSLGSALVSALLAASAISALFILADVDGNRFGEEDFAIGTYQAVFKAMGELPYYPSHYLTMGRFKPTDGQYRTGSPNSVKVVNNPRK